MPLRGSRLRRKVKKFETHFDKLVCYKLLLILVPLRGSRLRRKVEKFETHFDKLVCYNPVFDS
jgi:hypothetical protein